MNRSLIILTLMENMTINSLPSRVGVNELIVNIVFMGKHTNIHIQ